MLTEWTSCLRFLPAEATGSYLAKTQTWSVHVKVLFTFSPLENCLNFLPQRPALSFMTLMTWVPVSLSSPVPHFTLHLFFTISSNTTQYIIPSELCLLSCLLNLEFLSQLVPMTQACDNLLFKVPLKYHFLHEAFLSFLLLCLWFHKRGPEAMAALISCNFSSC